MTEKLKPCPFCGCEADFDEDLGDGITCANTEGSCGFYFNNDGGWTREEVAALWNRRTSPAPTATPEPTGLRVFVAGQQDTPSEISEAPEPTATSSNWWCPHCQIEIPGDAVTFHETHDPRVKGGCGYSVLPDRPAVEPTASDPAKNWFPGKLMKKLRDAGWSVAVHNDYKLNGQHHTFWLFTHPNGRYLKGEGVSDTDALTTCVEEMAKPEPTASDRARGDK